MSQRLPSPPSATIVALSGPDNVGKSTQARLLARRGGMTGLGALDAHDPRWAPARSAGLADWWFRDAPVSEVTDVLACSYLARAGTAVGEPRTWLADRGMPMLEASVAATVAVREHLGCEAAAARVAQLLAPYQQDLERAEAAEVGVLLLHDDDPGAGAARALAREQHVSARYAAYQRALHAHLHAQARGGRFAAVITAGDRSILAVQHEIAVRLGEWPGLDVPEVALQQVKVVALGGLSESGKSTAGHYLATRHGYARLKIGYLLAAAAARHQVPDVYSLEAAGIAELIADSLEDYCRAHHFQRRVSIESLHRANVTAELAKLLGPSPRAWPTSTSRRRHPGGTRGNGPDRRAAARDAVKRARGADGGPRASQTWSSTTTAPSSPFTTPWTGSRPTAAGRRRGSDGARSPGSACQAHLAAYVHRPARPPRRAPRPADVAGDGDRQRRRAGSTRRGGPRSTCWQSQARPRCQGSGWRWVTSPPISTASGSASPSCRGPECARRGADPTAAAHAGDDRRRPAAGTVVHGGDCGCRARTRRRTRWPAWQDGIVAVTEVRRQLLKQALDLRSLLQGDRAGGEGRAARRRRRASRRRRRPARPDPPLPGGFPRARQRARSTAAPGDEQAAARLATAVVDWWLSTLPPAKAAARDRSRHYHAADGTFRKVHAARPGLPGRQRAARRSPGCFPVPRLHGVELAGSGECEVVYEDVFASRRCGRLLADAIDDCRS